MVFGRLDEALSGGKSTHEFARGRKQRGKETLVTEPFSINPRLPPVRLRTPTP